MNYSFKSLPSEEDMHRLVEVAKMVCRSGSFTAIRSVEQAVTIMLLGMDYGLPPLTAVAQIHVLKGKPSLSAGAQSAIAKRSGRYTWTVKKLTNEECHLVFLQRDSNSDSGWMELGPASFTMEDAKQAGLLGNMTWKKYAQDMLFARAVSRGVKRYCADEFGGSTYVEGELEAEDTDTPTVKKKKKPVVSTAPSFAVVAAAAWAMEKKAFDKEADALAAAREISKLEISEEEKRKKWLEVVKSASPAEE